MKIVNIPFPMRGIHKGFAYESQPEGTTPSCQNVRPRSTRERRIRGGSRPGFTLAKYSQISGAANPVRMLNTVKVVSTDQKTHWEDTMEGTAIGGVWSAASWATGAPSISGGFATSSVLNQQDGAVRTDLTPLTTAEYDVSIEIVPYQGSHHGDYNIFCLMNNTTPDVTSEGILVTLTATASGTLSGSAKRYSGSALTNTYNFTISNDSEALPGWLTIRIDEATPNIKVLWRGTQVLSQNITLPTSSGQRVGYGMKMTQTGGKCQVNRFRVDYQLNDNAKRIKHVLVSSANGALWKESFTTGLMEAVSATPNLASNRPLDSVDRAQKLYIADLDKTRLEGTDGVISGAGNNVLDAASISDWTAHNIDVNNDVVFLHTTSGPTAGIYKLTTVASGTVTITGNADAGGTCSYRFERSPKIYDPGANTLTLWFATAGDVPISCPLVAVYRDRLVLAGSEDVPHEWYMSRQAAPLDFDYNNDAGDAQRAISSVTSEAGQIADAITALAPMSRNRMIFGGTHSIYRLTGDPAMGGQINPIDLETGILSQSALTLGSGGELYFMSARGLHMIDPTGSEVTDLSPDVLPSDLLNIDPHLVNITLRYDKQENGIHIFIAGEEKTGHTHYWYDLNTAGFFPVVVATDSEAMCSTAYTARSQEDEKVVFGCRDGYLREFNGLHETDDGTEIVSNFTIVLRPGNGYHSSMITELDAVLDADSGGMAWAVHESDTSEEVQDATALASGSFSAGANVKARPRVRGGSLMLKCSNNVADRAFFIERITAVLKSTGRQRNY